ncbi:MAG TPA: S41 family peptidase [Phycisphaerae bacterium]|nr:S41 family peptidase [Phycisphaerae bacterium]
MWHRLGELDWDTEFRRRIAQVLPEQSDWEYYRRLQAFVALAHDPHVSVTPPSRLRKQEDVSPPVRLWYVADQYVVVGYAVDAESRGQLALGDALVEVDGTPVGAYAAAHIIPYLPSATDHGRRLDTASRLLRGARGTAVEVTLRKPDGRLYTCRWSRKEQSGQTPWTLYNPLSRDGRITTRRIARNIGYVKISSFSDSEVVRQFDEALTSLGQIDGLIIDLRGNSGGNSGNGDRIIQRLIKTDLPGMVERRATYAPALRGWGRGENGTGVTWEVVQMPSLTPAINTPSFLGELVLLISAATASAAEDFVGPLAVGGRAKTIGEPTCGSTGNPLMLELPGGGSFRVCTRYMLLPDKSEFIGMGIQPDVLAKPTVEDVATGRDPVLERAIAEFRR